MQSSFAKRFGSEIVDFTGHESYCVWHENTEDRCVPAPEATGEPLFLLAEYYPYRPSARYPASRTTNRSFAEQCHRDAETAHRPGRRLMMC